MVMAKSKLTDIPTRSLQDTVSDNNNFDAEQIQAKIRHGELMCKLSDIALNLERLVVMWSMALDLDISKEDVR